LREDIGPLSIHVLDQQEKRWKPMSKASQYEERTEKLITPILEEMQFELVDVEYVKEGSMYYLRTYIDKEGGITINDCEAVARRMNELLDQEDFIPDSYTFEVSSPGLGRQLKKEKDFVRNMGKEVEIRTYRAIDRCKEFYGILTAYDKESVTIADEKEKTTTFLRADIALIRQAIDL
jgi:ribosome maturation factor RimP